MSVIREDDIVASVADALLNEGVRRAYLNPDNKLRVHRARSRRECSASALAGGRKRPCCSRKNR